MPPMSVSVGGKDSEFFQLVTALKICIDENLIFDIHIDNICLKQVDELMLCNDFPVC